MRGTRVTITLFFFADGLLLGSWASRIPAVQNRAGLTSSELGLALFAMSLGALVSMPFAGWVCERAGSRIVSVAALVAGSASLVLAALASGLGELAAALFGFGAGFGAVNVAINAQGLALERLYGRTILSSFHAAFSAGALAGAGIGALVAAAGIAPRAHFGLLAVTLAAGALPAARRLRPPDRSDGPAAPIVVRPPRVLLVLGAAAFFTLLAEGAVADWSAVYLSHSLGTSAALAALGYTAFSLAMTASRITGDRLERRLGPVLLARSGSVIAAAGLGLALAVGTSTAALAGFAAMGAGLGVIVPVLFRAAGSTPGVPAGVGIAAVSTIGWLGFLTGPPTIGFAAGVAGLRTALGVVVLSTAMVAFLAQGAARRRGDPWSSRMGRAASGLCDGLASPSAMRPVQPGPR